MLDQIIPKLLREYMATEDPARRAELVQVLQDYGAFPRIFEVCDQVLSPQADAEDSLQVKSNEGAARPAPKQKARIARTSTTEHFSTTIDP